MPGTITTGSVSRLLQEGVHNVFGNSLAEHPNKWMMLFEELKSNKAFELAVQMEGFGLASQKAEGDDITFDSRRQGFTPKYIHTTFAKGYIVTREALEDELYGQLSDGAMALARSMRITREVQGASIFNNGFDTNFQMVDGDGSQLFSTTHANGPSGGTYSNTLAVAADFAEASLEDLLIQIGEIEDARGLKMDLQAVRLAGSPTNTFEFQRVMGSVLQNNTANNATNAVRDMSAVRDGFMINPYFISPQAWFLTTDAPNGLKHYDRREIEFGQDNAFSSENARFKASYRDSFGWDDSRGVFGSAGV